MSLLGEAVASRTEGLQRCSRRRRSRRCSPGLAAGRRGADPLARQRLLQGLLGGLADAGTEGRKHQGRGRPNSKNPPSTVPQTPLPNITYATGGVTIMAGGVAIGAIGVSGAPGGQFDEECARAALRQDPGSNEIKRVLSPAPACPPSQTRWKCLVGVPKNSAASWISQLIEIHVRCLARCYFSSRLTAAATRPPFLLSIKASHFASSRTSSTTIRNSSTTRS